MRHEFKDQKSGKQSQKHLGEDFPRSEHSSDFEKFNHQEYEQCEMNLGVGADRVNSHGIEDLNDANLENKFVEMVDFQEDEDEFERGYDYVEPNKLIHHPTEKVEEKNDDEEQIYSVLPDVEKIPTEKRIPEVDEDTENNNVSSKYNSNQENMSTNRKDPLNIPNQIKDSGNQLRQRELDSDDEIQMNEPIDEEEKFEENDDEGGRKPSPKFLQNKPEYLQNPSEKDNQADGDYYFNKDQPFDSPLEKKAPGASEKDLMDEKLRNILSSQEQLEKRDNENEGRNQDPSELINNNRDLQFSGSKVGGIGQIQENSQEFENNQSDGQRHQNEEDFEFQKHEKEIHYGQEKEGEDTNLENLDEKFRKLIRDPNEMKEIQNQGIEENDQQLDSKTPAVEELGIFDKNSQEFENKYLNGMEDENEEEQDLLNRAQVHHDEAEFIKDLIQQEEEGRDTPDQQKLTRDFTFKKTLVKVEDEKIPDYTIKGEVNQPGNMFYSPTKDAEDNGEKKDPLEVDEDEYVSIKNRYHKKKQQELKSKKIKKVSGTKSAAKSWMKKKKTKQNIPKDRTGSVDQEENRKMLSRGLGDRVKNGNQSQNDHHANDNSNKSVGHIPFDGKVSRIDGTEQDISHQGKIKNSSSQGYSDVKGNVYGPGNFTMHDDSFNEMNQFSKYIQDYDPHKLKDGIRDLRGPSMDSEESYYKRLQQHLSPEIPNTHQFNNKYNSPGNYDDKLLNSLSASDLKKNPDRISNIEISQRKFTSDYKEPGNFYNFGNNQKYRDETPSTFDIDYSLLDPDEELIIDRGIMKFHPGFSINYVSRWVQVTKTVMRFYKNYYHSVCSFRRPLAVIPLCAVKKVRSVKEQPPVTNNTRNTRNTGKTPYDKNQFEIVLAEDYESLYDLNKRKREVEEIKYELELVNKLEYQNRLRRRYQKYRSQCRMSKSPAPTFKVFMQDKRDEILRMSQSHPRLSFSTKLYEDEATKCDFKGNKSHDLLRPDLSTTTQRKHRDYQVSGDRSRISIDDHYIHESCSKSPQSRQKERGFKTGYLTKKDTPVKRSKTPFDSTMIVDGHLMPIRVNKANGGCPGANSEMKRLTKKKKNQALWSKRETEWFKNERRFILSTKTKEEKVKWIKALKQIIPK